MLEVLQQINRMFHPQALNKQDKDQVRNQQLVSAGLHTDSYSVTRVGNMLNVALECSTKVTTDTKTRFLLSHVCVRLKQHGQLQDSGHRVQKSLRGFDGVQWTGLETSGCRPCPVHDWFIRGGAPD